MNTLEKVISDINAYPSDDIPVGVFSKWLGIKRSTITRQIRDNEIESRFDGYKHHVPKQTVLAIANKHRSAILGWIRQKEIADEFEIKHQSLFHICESRKLEREQDYCGYVRFPPETVIKLKEILPQYLAQESVEFEGKKYFSIIKLAHDMALKIEKHQDTSRFRNGAERIYKCLYSWCKSKYIPYIFLPGKTNIYIPEYTYDELVNMVRVTDSAMLSGKSRRTIYNWIEQGLLQTSKSPSGSTLINVKDLDTTLIVKMQLALMKKHINDPTKLEQIGDFNSPFWHKEITKIRTLSSDFKHQTNNWSIFGRDKYLEEECGMEKSEMRATRAISRRKLKTNELSLDAPYGEDGEESFVDHMTDESENTVLEVALNEELNNLVANLPQEKQEIICKMFGMNDHKQMSLSQIAEEKGVKATDLQTEVEGILEELKEQLV
jgi:predicted DNA-binding transcriptional regulator AlpA